MWQRDLGYGWRFLRFTLYEAKKKGLHVYWDVRTTKQTESGTVVEMLNSGLEGFIPRAHEGEERLEIGKDFKALCIQCPTDRIRNEPKRSPWPEARSKRVNKPQPLFSHWMWQQSQAKIEKAKTMEKGSIVEGTVRQHVRKGMLVELEGEGKPVGLLGARDVSRLKCTPVYAMKMFPPGTKIKCYVCHADRNNGRITLSTKEFEDDDHVGWMIRFPQWCFKNAEEGVRRYHQKRDAYIEMLQR